MLQPELFSSGTTDIKNGGKRLLILACSEKKNHAPDLIPAIERYDGPMWKVLRNFSKQQANREAQLDVYVLSAEFGLIPAMKPVPLYDRLMTLERVRELQGPTIDQFCLLLDHGYSRICLALSKLYLRTFNGWENIVPEEAKVTVIDGPMATKLGQLRSWLREDIWKPTEYAPNYRLKAKQPRSEVIIKGVSIHLSRDEVLSRARAALATGAIGADNYRDWYVLVDGRPVATKWLVELISGVSVDRFDASAARRVLLGLGIDVVRSH